MPIYEYRCDNCGHEFETIQKVSDDPLTSCPACAEDSLRKKISAAGFRLKGGGWYETDFKSGGKKNVAGAERSSSDDSSGGTGKSADKSGSEKAASSGSGSAAGSSASSGASVSGGSSPATKSD